MDADFNMPEPASGIPVFQTPALHDSWKSILAWADENFVSKSLAHVVNATQILEQHDFLRNILEFLIEKESFALLGEWADANDLNQLSDPSTPAQHLYQLARAAVKDGSVFQLLEGRFG